ncbi:MAG: hypothetical protein FWE32_09765 [Oscillospiraceae bacterium]|nr:hypothetical protein [Oscillospiraceae bacterium]
MKKTRRVTAVFLALVFVVAMAVPVAATPVDEVFIVVNSEEEMLNYRFDPNLNEVLVLSIDTPQSRSMNWCSNCNQRGLGLVMERRQSGVTVRGCPMIGLASDRKFHHTNTEVMRCTMCGWRQAGRTFIDYVAECHDNTSRTWAVVPGRTTDHGVDIHACWRFWTTGQGAWWR